MKTTAINGVGRVLKVMAIIFMAMLVTPQISVVPIEFSRYVAAETPELSLEADFSVIRWEPSVAWSTAHENATYYQNQTYSDTSGTYHETGYLKTKAAVGTTDYANRNISIAAGSSYAMFEMMYMAVSLDAKDHVQMNLTLNRTNAAPTYDFDQLAIGNEYNVPTVWYKNSLQNQTIDLGFTFEEDVWYVAILYINDNYTADAEMRWASNYTLAGSSHISALNLSAPENVTLMNITNNNAAGGGGNEYWFEYAFYTLAGDFTGIGDSSANTAFGNYQPDDKDTMSKLFDKEVDADIDADVENMSAGSNNSAALALKDYFDNGGTAPASINSFEKSNSSWYSAQDVKHICAMTREKNTSYEHRQAAEWSFTDDFQTYILNAVRKQFDKDEDDGVFVDYRLASVNFTITFSDSFREKVRDDFIEGVEGSDADIEACWLDPTMNAEAGLFDGISGAWGDVTNGIGDGLGNVYDNTLGGFGASMQGTGEWISGGFMGFGEGINNIGQGLFDMTSSTIGSIVSGAAEFTADIVSFVCTSAARLITAPFSFLMSMTGKLLFWVGLVVIGIIILVLFIVWKRSAAKHEGGKTSKADISSGG